MLLDLENKTELAEFISGSGLKTVSSHPQDYLFVAGEQLLHLQNFGEPSAAKSEWRPVPAAGRSSEIESNLAEKPRLITYLAVARSG